MPRCGVEPAAGPVGEHEVVARHDDPAAEPRERVAVDDGDHRAVAAGGADHRGARAVVRRAPHVGGNRRHTAHTGRRGLPGRPPRSERVSAASNGAVGGGRRCPPCAPDAPRRGPRPFGRCERETSRRARHHVTDRLDDRLPDRPPETRRLETPTPRAPPPSRQGERALPGDRLSVRVVHPVPARCSPPPPAAWPGPTGACTQSAHGIRRRPIDGASGEPAATEPAARPARRSRRRPPVDRRSSAPPARHRPDVATSARPRGAPPIASSASGWRPPASTTTATRSPPKPHFGGSRTVSASAAATAAS